jgi:peptidoglycan/LPS O-acetylase OafA/YrhL
VAEDRFAGGWHWQAAAASLTEGVLATCVSLWAIGYFRHHHNRLRPLAGRMARAAYGAFIIHPPVLVGLALAVHSLPLPAELKFVFVLTGGVAASFGLAALAARVRPGRPGHRHRTAWRPGGPERRPRAGACCARRRATPGKPHQRCCALSDASLVPSLPGTMPLARRRCRAVGGASPALR